MSGKHEDSYSSVDVFAAIACVAGIISFLCGLQYYPFSGPLLLILGGVGAAVAFGLSAIALAVENLANRRDDKERDSQSTS